MSKKIASSRLFEGYSFQNHFKRIAHIEKVCPEICCFVRYPLRHSPSLQGTVMVSYEQIFENNKKWIAA
ncbi:MAG TPA: hypothetical protein PKH43_11430, partial [Saprospiraceae bacterium]|nr:hypothetical protein [Saprospiraceae bacterium]